VWLATAPLLLIEEPVPGDRFWWPSLIYIPATLLLAAEFLRRRDIERRHAAGNGEAKWTLQRF
jgi:hypothetical protein